MTLLQLSDLHFGKPHRPLAAAAVLRLADQLRPDAVVVSGDLTQRAKAKEYRGAAALLARLRSAVPLVVVPGNHDAPLYRFWERLTSPYGKYRRHVSPELDSVLDVPSPGGGPASAAGARFVALNSTAPRTAIVNGRLSDRQLRFAAGAFASAPRAACRVLVLHHNLVPPEDAEPGPGPVRTAGPPPLHGASRVLDRLAEWKVDLVFSGHVHRSWTTCRRGTPLIHAGTASSSRGRGPERGLNSVNVVDVQPSETYVVAYLYSKDGRRFLPGKGSRHRRRSRAVRGSDGPGQEREPSDGAGPHP